MQSTAENIFTPKDANPVLTSLHEISAPSGINWMPQTLGWQLLLLLAFCYLLYRLYLQIKRYISNAYRRAAIVELDACAESSEGYEKVSKILRRTALYAFERNQVAPLIGADWESWLDKQCKGTDFSGEFKGLLSQLAYAPHSFDSQPAISPDKLSSFKSQVAIWVKHHRGHYG
ncbi:DUF4381 domain-containing protein [Colwellia psychrerythraea]|uniref:DUF4381 domain-containing protein n=1 Tax=Colwellia psychrerythraea TaxID=28229 RepID=A0A099KWX5_COLPS|nr:DUF4381 domain-containing protein [Colwellia psychrerythraea]KGJ94128.1 hypothetical protein ND2E_2061 [Colwellia psychrerythraea]